MKKLSLILAGLTVSAFASFAHASKQNCRLTSIDAKTGTQYFYNMEVFWSNETGMPYHILVEDYLGRAQTFDNNSTINPTIVEVTDGYQESGYIVKGKDGVGSIQIVWTGETVHGNADAIKVTAVLPTLGFKHVEAPISGYCR